MTESAVSEPILRDLIESLKAVNLSGHRRHLNQSSTPYATALEEQQCELLTWQGFVRDMSNANAASLLLPATQCLQPNYVIKLRHTNAALALNTNNAGLMFHGSALENIASIVENGFQMNLV